MLCLHGQAVCPGLICLHKTQQWISQSITIFTEPRGDWLKTSVEKKPIEQQYSLASDTACLAMLGYIKLLLRNAKTQVDAKLKIW